MHTFNVAIVLYGYMFRPLQR